METEQFADGEIPWKKTFTIKDNMKRSQTEKMRPTWVNEKGTKMEHTLVTVGSLQTTPVRSVDYTE